MAKYGKLLCFMVHGLNVVKLPAFTIRYYWHCLSYNWTESNYDRSASQFKFKLVICKHDYIRLTVVIATTKQISCAPIQLFYLTSHAWKCAYRFKQVIQFFIDLSASTVCDMILINYFYNWFVFMYYFFMLYSMLCSFTF